MKRVVAFGLMGALLVASPLASAQSNPRGGGANKPGSKAPAASNSANPAAASSANAAAVPSKNRAEVPVLTLASDDADDQAEALSGAIRSRLRERSDVAVDDTTMNLTTLIAALACSERPDPLCLIKIGDQFKVDRFIWGFVKRASDRSQLTAEVHLWRRGKGDLVATETFAENLRDQNDDVLRRIAGRFVDRLFLTPVAAAITMRAGADVAGEVMVDQKDHFAFEHGETVFELRPGHHTLEVRANGYESAVQPVDVVAGTAQIVNVHLAPIQLPPPPKPSKPISARTIVALSFIGVGVGVGVAGTVKAAQFLSVREENARDHDTLGAEDFCNASKPHTADVPSMQAACARIARGKDLRSQELVLYGIATGVAAVGIVLLITDTPEPPKTAKIRDLRLLPTVGKSSGGVDLSFRF